MFLTLYNSVQITHNGDANDPENIGTGSGCDHGLFALHRCVFRHEKPTGRDMENGQRNH